MTISNLNKHLIEKELSQKISRAVTDSFGEAPLLLDVGSVLVPCAAIVIARRTALPALWLCAVLLSLIACLRVAILALYRARVPVVGEDRLLRWKTLHHLGAVVQRTLIGAWCFLVITITDDVVVHMITVAVTTGMIATSAATTYRRLAVFQQQVLLSYAPLTLALAFKGTPYYLFLSALMLGFVVTVLRIAANLHGHFIGSLTSREYAAALADQLDAALNHMPHGLCMLHPSGQVVIVNQRFREILNLADDILTDDPSAQEVIAQCVSAAHLRAADAEELLEEIRTSNAATIVTTADGGRRSSQALSWSTQRMANGGAVLVIEEVASRRVDASQGEHLASYDALTKLPTRATFRHKIEGLLASGEASALHFIDLDRFKQVNDTLGHACGDKLLSMVASRLRSTLRADDLVGRFGGDEFMVFQRNISSELEAAVMAERIVSHLSERYHIDSNPIQIGASVGIALTGSDARSFDALLKHADLALYSAKTETRAAYRFFHSDMASRVEARRSLELDLRRALENKELELFYQPLIDLKTGRITSCEALLRWRHPVRGILRPNHIISVAEDIGIMAELGDWILREACRECAGWPEGVRVAVNISPRQLGQEDILAKTRNALALSDLAAHRLETEITEKSLLANSRETHEVLSQLHALGVGISLDDFGTGYSSLSYLHNFPLQKVKIDRSFLDSLDSTRSLTLLRGVAQLINDLGMSVLVEGIETSEQLKLITDNCTVTEGQGYLFGHPAPASRIRDMLHAADGLLPRPAGAG
ncbi:MAG: EAL domain-containing protein [Alphaproteobacteria bacterium]|nr:EAL domain-containing protein [Alphaproteobacteria bacterium]